MTPNPRGRPLGCPKTPEQVSGNDRNRCPKTIGAIKLVAGGRSSRRGAADESVEAGDEATVAFGFLDPAPLLGVSSQRVGVDSLR